MSLEERLEQAEKLVADVKAELAAMRATKRNWPERIEAGMVFRVNGESMMVPNGKPVSYVIALTGEKVGMSHYGWESAPGIEYLGHARDTLTIRTDAHEPTGAELVGRVVEVTNDPDDMTWGRTYNGKPIVVTDHQPDHACPYKVGEAGNWKFARLAR